MKYKGLPAPPALGVVTGEPVEQRTNNFEIGDNLLLYTDGLTEGANADNEMYGVVRLTEAVRRHGTSGVAPLLQRVLEDQTAFEAARDLIREADELTAIFVSSLKTERGKL